MADAESVTALEAEPPLATHRCRKCARTVDEPTFALELRVCGGCGHHAALTALEWIDHLADPGTFREIGKRLFSKCFVCPQRELIVVNRLLEVVG